MGRWRWVVLIVVVVIVALALFFPRPVHGPVRNLSLNGNAAHGAYLI